MKETLRKYRKQIQMAKMLLNDQILLALENNELDDAQEIVLDNALADIDSGLQTIEEIERELD
jgi:hypothetical protein